MASISPTASHNSFGGGAWNPRSDNSHIDEEHKSVDWDWVIKELGVPEGGVRFLCDVINSPPKDSGHASALDRDATQRKAAK